MLLSFLRRFVPRHGMAIHAEERYSAEMQHPDLPWKIRSSQRRDVNKGQYHPPR